MALFCTSSPARRLALLLVSLSSLLFGSSLLAFKDQLFSQLIASQLVVQEGTASYNAWKETPIPVYTKFYFFNMLNPQDLFMSHEMPILLEQGPYTFREVEKKVNIHFHEDGTVSYRRMKHWYFERSMSVGPLTDTVTTINVPVVGSAEFVRGNFFMEWGISDMLATIQASIFVKKTVGELLFDGYADTVMDIQSSFGEDYGEEDLSGGAGEENKDKIPMDKFGWFYKRNGSSWSDGDLVMFTGRPNISQLGKIDTWNGEHASGAYKGRCGQVTGSADGLFPPGTAFKTDSISIYSTDLCRSLKFTRESDQLVHGIPVVKFQLAEDTFSNGTVCPANGCYENNLHTGVLNVTQCKVKSPAFVSRPHFHLADPFYKDQFQYGIEPRAGLHDSSFWLEPHSSIPVRVEMRLQLNILLEKVPGIEYLFKDLQRIMFPVLWFDSVAAVPDDMVSSLKLLVSLPLMFQASGVLAIIFGAVLLCILCLYKCRESRRSGKAPPGMAAEIAPSGYQTVPGAEWQSGRL